MSVMRDVEDEPEHDLERMDPLRGRTLKRRKLFLREAGKLCQSIDEWTRGTFLSAGDQTARLTWTTLHDSFGEYEAPGLALERKTVTLRVAPVGRIAGGLGKVVLIVCGKNQSLILKEDGWKVASIISGRYVFTKFNHNVFSHLIRRFALEGVAGGGVLVK